MNKPLNQKQAAELLGVHYNSIRRYVKTGKLRCTRIGDRKLQFNQSDVLSLKKEVNATPANGGARICRK